MEFSKIELHPSSMLGLPGSKTSMTRMCLIKHSSVSHRANISALYCPHCTAIKQNPSQSNTAASRLTQLFVFHQWVHLLICLSAITEMCFTETCRSQRAAMLNGSSSPERSPRWPSTSVLPEFVGPRFACPSPEIAQALSDILVHSFYPAPL